MAPRQYYQPMHASSNGDAGIDLHKVQQVIKWVVYSLLIVNFGFYIVEDWTRARHTLDASSTFLDWAGEFATSIDESAWFILLFMFELETYVLEDEAWTGWVARLVHGVRILCIAMIAHTVFAYSDTLIAYQPTVEVPGVIDPCELSDRQVSYVYNLEYTAITEETCGDLPCGTQYYEVGDNPVVSTLAGLKLERQLAWADVFEVVTWLLILLAIEIVIRLQDRNVAGGRLIRALNGLKIAMYLFLIVLGIYWATLSHWLYLWDELVWIGGFIVIEMNISEWRKELLGAGQPDNSLTAR